MAIYTCIGAFAGLVILGFLILAIASALRRHATDIAASGQPSVSRREPTEIVATAEPSVALIKGRLSSGSGFLIHDRILATNRHVIDVELTRHLKVHFPSAPQENRGPFPASLLYVDADVDLALLRVDVPIAPLKCATAYTFRRGEDIVVIGNPGVSGDVVLQNAVSRGMMSTQAVIDGQQYDQLSISINPGNSGGPVLDGSGSVIGVVTMKASGKEGLAFSIPIEAVNAGLTKAGQMSQEAVAKTQAMHRARVVFKYVNSTGLLYKVGMGIYTDAMNKAIESGMSADTGLTLARSAIEREISGVDEVLIGDLKKELSAISTDPHIPDSTRQRIVELWTNYLELKSYVENPRGTFVSYRAKHLELSDAHDRLAESLKLLLDADK